MTSPASRTLAAIGALHRTRLLVATTALVVAGACATSGGHPARVDRAGAPAPATTPAGSTSSSTSSTSSTATALAGGAFTRPPWIGTRVLPRRPDGLGEVQPTPPELVDRRFQAPDLLPPPSVDGFAATVASVPEEVAGRSTWQPGCPVRLEDLRYVTLPFWGFDGRRHTGELLLHRDAVDAVVAGFRGLHERRFPIEEMRITQAAELDLPPTGDGNNTTAFVCRATRGSTRWSEHAHGRAVDVNPFHNPYVKGDVVLPELASAYVDRDDVRPGMLLAGSPEVAAFTDAGWRWGGAWRTLKDTMHLSASGR